MVAFQLQRLCMHVWQLQQIVAAAAAAAEGHRPGFERTMRMPLAIYANERRLFADCLSVCPCVRLFVYMPEGGGPEWRLVNVVVKLCIVCGRAWMCACEHVFAGVSTLIEISAEFSIKS